MEGVTMMSDVNNPHLIKSSEDLMMLRNKVRKAMTSRIRVQVGMGTCGLAAGAGKVHDRFKELCQEHGIDVDLSPVGCMGECAFEPMVEIVEIDGSSTIYCKVTKTIAEEIFKSHLLAGKPLDKYSLSRFKK